MAAVDPLVSTRLLSRPVLNMEVRAEGGHVSAVTPERAPLLLPMVLVTRGLELCFDLAMMEHILADFYARRGTNANVRPGLVELPALLEPSHEATDDGQARHPGAGSRSWPWNWVVAVDAEDARTR